MRPHLVAETALPGSSDVTHLDRVGWLATHPADATVTLLDERLRVTARLPVPTGGAAFEASVNERYVAVVSLDQLAVLDRQGRPLWRQEQSIEAIGLPCAPSCFLDTRDVLWVYLPEGDDLLAVDAATGDEIDRTRLPSELGAGYFRPHPDRSRLGLHVPMGQDGSYSFLARLDDGRIDCRTLAGECLVGFTSTGERYLSMPHVDGEIGIHDVATGAVLVACAAARIPGYDTGSVHILLEAAALVSDEHVVVGVNTDQFETDAEEHLLLSTRDLGHLATLDYGQPMTQYSIRAAGGRGRWLTTGHDDDAVRLWELPPTR